MPKIIFLQLFKLLRIFRIPQLLNRLIEEEKKQICARRVLKEANVRFGTDALVHNSQGPERIRIGANTIVDGELLVHDYGGRIEIGRNTYVGKGSRIWSGATVKVGNDVFIAHNVNITDSNSHQISVKERAEHFQRTLVEGRPFEKSSIETAPVVIGDHAWINFNVGILKGVTIGEGAIVGACSLVLKDVPPYTMVAGIPAKVIKELPRE